jgi:hypothetical protein
MTTLIQAAVHNLDGGPVRRGTAINAFEMILPFLKPLQHLILDETIGEVMVNGPSCAFMERDGFVEEVRGLPIDLSRHRRSCHPTVFSRKPGPFDSE